MPLPLADVPCAVVTVSDRAASGERTDTSGPILCGALTAAGASVVSSVIPDGRGGVADAIRKAIADGARIVLTCGGTGIAPRDETPEGTADVVDRSLPGIAEALRAADAQGGPGAALSRGLAGTVKGTPPALVVNVPGSPAAATTAARVLPAVLAHAIQQLDGVDH